MRRSENMTKKGKNPKQLLGVSGGYDAGSSSGVFIGGFINPEIVDKLRISGLLQGKSNQAIIEEALKERLGTADLNEITLQVAKASVDIWKNSQVWNRYKLSYERVKLSVWKDDFKRMLRRKGISTNAITLIIKQFNEGVKVEKNKHKSEEAGKRKKTTSGK